MSEILWEPNPGPQTHFLASEAREVLYGGAVGGGKTDAINALPLRWADHPKHRAIILRRTRPQLQETIDRTRMLYHQVAPGAEWRESESRWLFPSGAIIQMGHAEHESDIMQYKSFEYNLVCFDELTSFLEAQYRFMFLRNRTKSQDLPLWVRSATNPGDIGHEWVYKRFIENRQPFRVYEDKFEAEEGRPLVVTRQYIPSRVWDNPKLPDRDAYIAGIVASGMSDEDIAAYLYGDWTRLAGAMFKVLPTTTDTNSVLTNDYYVLRCMDYGWDDHTCVLWLVVYPNVGVVDVAGEVYVRETTLAGIANYVNAKQRDLGLREPVMTVGGSDMFKSALDGQTIAQQLSVLGLTVVPADDGPGTRVTGWTRLQEVLQRKGLRVWPGAAPNLMRTLPTLQRDKVKVNDVRTGAKGKQEDHAADALRYGLMAVYDNMASAPAIIAPELPPGLKDEKFEELMKHLNSKKHEYPQLGGWR